MLVQTDRSGLVEAIDTVDVVAVDIDGAILDARGEFESPLYYRSAIKLLQASVSVELGGTLAPEHLAVACASHAGHPAHISVVESMLAAAQLDHSALRCPPSWPLAESATHRLVSQGFDQPRPLWHNCSGKHAAMLRACVAQGWPTDTYLEADHPLQQAMLERVEWATQRTARPAGIDGCGAPAFRGTLHGLARSFAVVSDHPQFVDVADAVRRFGCLAGDNLRPDGALSRWWDGPLKVGAMGLIGAGRRGVGLAAKSRSGSATNAVVGIMESMRRLEMLSPTATDALEAVAHPVVHGGGRPVGTTAICDD